MLFLEQLTERDMSDIPRIPFHTTGDGPPKKEAKKGDEPKKPSSVLPPALSRPDAPPRVDPEKSSEAVNSAREKAEAAAEAAASDTEPPSPDDAPESPEDGPDGHEGAEPLEPIEGMDKETSKLERLGQLGKAGWEKSSGARGKGGAVADFFGRLGWGGTKLAGRTSMRVVDRAGWGLDKLGDWMLRQSKKINKGKPILGVETAVKLIGWVQDKTGFKKRLGETLKERKEERKKLAKKVYDQMIKDELKWEKDLKAKEKKAKREKKIKARFGDEAGSLLIDEFPDEHKDLDKGDAEPAKAAA